MKASKTHALSRKTKGDILFEALLYLLLVMALILTLYPLLYVLSASFSNPMKVLNGELILLPRGLTLQGYTAVFENKDILTGYLNTIFITVVGTALNIALTILAAYPLSRRDLWGRNAMMMGITFTMFFSGGIIPTYLVIQKLGLMGSLWALILPVAVSTYNIIIMRTYFQNSIPFELQEAALIDGCTNFKILLRIILPLSGPIVAVIGLYYAVSHWNAYFNAMMYLTDRGRYPLQLILREILLQNQLSSMMELDMESMAEQALRGEVIKYSVIVVSSLPMLIIYPFVQRFFIKGVMIGAVKG